MQIENMRFTLNLDTLDESIPKQGKHNIDRIRRRISGYLATILRHKRWSEQQIRETFDLGPSETKALMAQRTEFFSLDKLLTFLELMGYTMVITDRRPVRQPPAKQEFTAIERAFAAFPDLITEAEMAKIMQVRPSTLQRHRALCKGLPYIRTDKGVRYLKEEVIEYLESRVVRTTRSNPSQLYFNGKPVPPGEDYNM